MECTTSSSDAISQVPKRAELAIVCETILTVHQSKGDEHKVWEVVDYGIPAIVSNREGLQIHVGDVETGEVVRRIPVDTASHYSVSNDYFHVLTCDGMSGSECEPATVYGLSFTHVNVAKKVVKAVERLAPSEDSLGEGGTITSAKRPKLAEEGVSLDDRVVNEKEDVPSQEEEAEAGEDGDESVDAAFGTLRKSFRRKKTKIAAADSQGGKEISAPVGFKHLIHVDTESTVGQLKAVMSGEQALLDAARHESQVSGQGDLPAEAEPVPEPSKPQPNVPPSPPVVIPTPPAPPTHKRALSRTRIPVPAPPTLSDHEALLIEITQFNRNRLRPVDREEIARTPNMPDSKEEHVDLNSLLRSGLERMRGKLELSFSHMSSITSTGEDEFDDFD